MEQKHLAGGPSRPVGQCQDTLLLALWQSPGVPTPYRGFFTPLRPKTATWTMLLLLSLGLTHRGHCQVPFREAPAPDRESFQPAHLDEEGGWELYQLLLWGSFLLSGGWGPPMRPAQGLGAHIYQSLGPGPSSISIPRCPSLQYSPDRLGETQPTRALKTKSMLQNRNWCYY